MVQAAQTAAAPANGTTGKSAAAAAAAAGKDGHPAANGAPKASTPDAPMENGNAVEASAASTPEAKEAEELRKKEDAIAAKGAEIAAIRALLTRAFSKPAEEPARLRSHWTYLLEEMAWLAIDYTQERHWRRCTALAIAYEIAKMKGDFGLKQPPKEFRKYSDEIRELRAAVAKSDGASVTPATTGRRASARKADPGSSGLSPAVFLGLDPSSDPVFADFEAADGLIPSTPPTEDGIAMAVAFPCDEEFAAALEKSLMTSEVDRLIQDEIAYRSYRLEYEAAVVSHQMAVQEQIAAANNIGDLGLGPAFGVEAEEPDSFAAAAKKSNKRRNKGGARSGGPGGVAVGGGILGLDEFGDDDDFSAGNKRSKAAALVEDVYLRKKRPSRIPSYRNEDLDYDAAQEVGGSRYSTRRQTGALQRNQAARLQAAERNRRPAGRTDTYQQQQAARLRAQAIAPGMLLWSKAEDELLLAVVHEFGINWTLVSEVLSLSLGMQGIYRPSQQCRQRFRQLTMQEGHDYSEERAYAALSQQLSKQQARELLVGSLPVRDNELVRLLEALVQVGASANAKRAMEERRNEPQRTRRQDMHPSYGAILQAVMGQTGGRYLNPLELSNSVNNAYITQARQAMLQQQMQSQQQQQQQQGGGPGGGGAPLGGGTPGQPPPQQLQQGGPQPGQQGGVPPPGSAPGQQHGQQQQQGLAQGTPAGQLPLGMSGGSGGLPGAVPGQMPQGVPPTQGGVPGSMQPGAALGGGGPNNKPPGPQPPTPQVTLQQLNTILATNKLPNGQELDNNMRKAIEQKRTTFLAQMQQTQQRQQQALQAQQQGAAGQPGIATPGAAPNGQQQQQQPPQMQPGQHNNPSLAALQQASAAAAAAAAAAVAAGRPPLPPGMQGAMYALPPGQGMQLPPGVPGMVQQMQLPQGTLLGGPGVGGAGQLAQGATPGSLGGVVLPPSQQHILAAQQIMQQQAAAAAAHQAQQQKG